MTDKILKKKDIETKLDLSDQMKLDSTYAVDTTDKKVVRKDVMEASNQAKRLLKKALEEAEVIKEKARKILARVEEEMQKSKDQGFEQGKQEGLAQVTELLAKAKAEKQEMFKDVEKAMITLVYDIAEKILGKELAERETAIVDLIRQALESASGEKLIVLVNPQDLEKVKEHQSSLMQALDSIQTIQIRSDEKVSLNGCLIESEVGTIDARLETQLDAIKTALGLQAVTNEQPTTDEVDSE